MVRDLVHNTAVIATISKSGCNTFFVHFPWKYSNVLHYDIVYGAGTVKGGCLYKFWLVDRKTHLIHQYPLKSQDEEKFLFAIKLFVCNVGGALP
eukprot:4271309-Ditylum_brightwellii.AAC.4